MTHTRTKLTSRGKDSVPATARRMVHEVLFPEGVAPATLRTLNDLKQGIRQRMKRRHAGG